MYISIYPIAIDTKKDRETEHKSLSKTCKEEREVEKVYEKRQEDVIYLEGLDVIYFTLFI